MNISTRILFTSWLVASGIAGSPTPCVADTLVSIKDDVEVSGQTIRLSDVFAGVPAAIDRDIALAPAPCKPSVFDAAVLTKLAQTYRLDWQTQTGSSRVTVSSACTHISADAIRDAVVEKLKADSASKKLGFEVALDKRGMEIDLPVKDTPEFTLENFSFNRSARQFRADLTASTPRGAMVYPISGKVTVKRQVPMLARRLEAGTVIGSNDLDWTGMPEERVTADVITEPEQLLGREVRRDMPEGGILRSRDIMPQRLVQRNALVTIKVETPYMLITAQGKAQQDGAEGDTVRVVNTQSNRVIEGIVTAPGVVEIRVARKIALAE
ncbi:MAG: flagellar basal body P-ring formation chaperone FlgA [Alphaproteobacteria bacterium]|nr:flagellar basal body P-ring formation chaperone FlgA [Alphaproteobacteria bacterium]